MKTIAHVLAASSVLIGLVGLAGCREATNEPSAAEIQQSQERRAAAIDADTTLTQFSRGDLDVSSYQSMLAALPVSSASFPASTSALYRSRTSERDPALR